MKILITSDWNTDAINGVVTSINNLMYGLRARGHEVKLLALSSDHQTRITEDGWEVASLPQLTRLLPLESFHMQQ